MNLVIYIRRISRCLEKEFFERFGIRRSVMILDLAQIVT